MTNLPLSKIRVIDLSRGIAGPAAAQILGDFGAQVIKVERPMSGDESRGMGRIYLKDSEGRESTDGSIFLSANKNKKGITVDLSKPGGQDVIRKLTAVSDVIVENYKPGNLAKFGLDYASLRDVNPALIYCSVTGFGPKGPYSHRPGYDPIMQAVSGLLVLNRDSQDVPQQVPANPVDNTTSYFASIAILGALYERDANGGKGQHLDVALLDVAVASLAQRAQEYLMDGQEPGRSDLPGFCYNCKDGMIAVTLGNVRQWEAFCNLVGLNSLVSDERFRELSGRTRHRTYLMPIIQDRLSRYGVDEILPLLEKDGVPCGPVHNLEQVFNDPQVKYRRIVVDTPHPVSPELRTVRNPILMSETPLNLHAPPPTIGQHTDEILADWLGLDKAAIDALRNERSI